MSRTYEESFAELAALLPKAAFLETYCYLKTNGKFWARVQVPDKKGVNGYRYIEHRHGEADIVAALDALAESVRQYYR
jgi:hypothetical protein